MKGMFAMRKITTVFEDEQFSRSFKKKVHPEFFCENQQKLLYQFAYRKKTREHAKTAYKRKEKYDEVFKKHEVKDRLPYRCLDDFMAVEDLELKDVYSVFGQDIGPMRLEIKVIIELCSKLSEGSKEELLKVITLMTPTWWREIDALLTRPSQRVCLAFEQKKKIHDVDEEAMMGSLEYKKILENKSDSYASYFRAYPGFAKMLNVSLRWLLKDVTYVYSKDEKTESIIDAFYFLRPEVREGILESFRSNLSKKKDEEDV